ncbi:MAG: glycine zipper domain-containing protein [Chlamydiia bacterium]
MFRTGRQAVMAALFAMGCIAQTGCETKAQTGALTGAAVGTAAGALIGGNVGGAAIGAGLGVLAGGVVGLGMDESDRSREQPQPQQPFLRRVSYREIAGWVKHNEYANLNNLGQYQVTASDLNKLNAAYANQRFEAADSPLTTLQLAQLYGVICFFQSSTNPICSEPPELGQDVSSDQPSDMSSDSQVVSL